MIVGDKTGMKSPPERGSHICEPEKMESMEYSET